MSYKAAKQQTKKQNMKTETKVLDLKKLLAVKDTENKAVAARQTAQRELDKIITGTTVPALIDPCTLSAARRSKVEAEKASATFAALPKARREMAETAARIALEIGRRAAQMGHDYSGNTTYRASWGAEPCAYTSTEKGGQYSRKCTYSKTDATHTVKLTPEGSILLVESEALRQCSAREGLHLIALHADSSAVWVKTSGKQIVSQKGWIMGNAAICYHSTKSAADAQAGFARKLAIHEREQKLARAAGKVERRARLIARLCGSAVATIEDARRLGYCSPGIAAFQAAHGIADSATLPQLIRTGNASAAMLALSVARKISQKKELQTA